MLQIFYILCYCSLISVFFSYFKFKIGAGTLLSSQLHKKSYGNLMSSKYDQKNNLILIAKRNNYKIIRIHFATAK